MPWGSASSVREFILKSVFGSNKRTGAPATLYFALYREATTPATVLGTEPTSTGNYARVGMTNDDALWTISGPDITLNADVEWPQATGLYSITSALNQVVLLDSATLGAGTVWAWAELTTTITVTGATDQPRILSGNLDWQMAV